jgi:hypothetical protein
MRVAAGGGTVSGIPESLEAARAEVGRDGILRPIANRPACDVENAQRGRLPIGRRLSTCPTSAHADFWISGARSPAAHPYRTAKVTGGPGRSATVMMIGTAAPGATPSGTTTFTW